MRPPDQHQHGSTRPNLLSGARRQMAGDDNILARLERDSARQASGNRSRAAWYAAAAALVLLLIVTLAWTAYDNARAVRVVPMQHVATGTSAPATKPVAPDTSLRSAAPAGASSTTASTVPPLVLLPSHAAPARAPAPAPARTAALVPVPMPVPVPAPVPVRPAAPTVASTLAPARATSRPPAPARTHNPAGAGLKGEPVLDTDVALLSAIIIHDSAHAEEKAQLEAAAACTRSGARKCLARPVAGAGLAN